MKNEPIVNLLWVIAAVFLGLWILGGIFALLGFLIHIALILLKYALIIALIAAGVNLILSRLQR